MAITFAPGFTPVANGDFLSTPAPISITMRAPYGARGDKVLLCGFLNLGTTASIGLGGTASKNWQSLGNFIIDPAHDINAFMVVADVASTEEADVITIEYEAPPGAGAVLGNWWVMSITAGLGPDTVWNFGAGVGTLGVSAVIEYEALPRFHNANAQMYLGWAISGNSATGIDDDIFTFVDSPGPTVGNQGGSGNEIVYSFDPPEGNEWAPKSSQANTYWATIAVVIEAYPAPAPVNVVRGVPTWRFVVVGTDGTQIGELTAAKAKTITWPLNDAASASFTIDGLHPQAAMIQELATDLIVYDRAGNKAFRGRMGTSSDAIAPSGHLSTFSAVDYRGYYARRLVRGTAQLIFLDIEQADVAWQLITDSNNQPGAERIINRGVGSPTGVQRTITFGLNSSVADCINQIANVTDGFDWEINPDLAFNVYYPERGKVTTVVLEYGGSVLSAARTLDTSTFANVVVYSGAQALLPVEADAASFGPEGPWEVAIGDTSILDQYTLDIKATYELSKDEVLTPSYQMVLKAGWWTPEILWLGDTALVVVKSGRINDIASQRITQVQVEIGDDANNEVVTLTTGPVPQDEGKALDDALNRISTLEVTT